MSFADYKSFWDAKASTPLGAMTAVDGSTDESVLRATGAYTANQVRAALDLQAHDRVLELGCGVARIGRELAPEVAYWHGVDISANMLQHARARLRDFANVGTDVLTGTNLAMLPDASFDKAYCVAVFIHMDKEDMVLYLRELHRVLKPGGRLYFDVWNIAHPIGWKRFAYEIAQHAHATPGQRKDVARNQFYAPQEVAIYLQQCGFEQLLMLDDSPQLQAVAQRPGGEDALAVAVRVARRQEAIAYGPRWGQWFERLFAVFFEAEHPREAYAALLAESPDKDTLIYRIWLRNMWRQHEAQWGPAPLD